MDGRQSYGVERAEGRPAESRRTFLLPFWFASGFCPCRQRKKSLLVAMDQACPESGTSRGSSREGRVCSVVWRG